MSELAVSKVLDDERRDGAAELDRAAWSARQPPIVRRASQLPVRRLEGTKPSCSAATIVR